MPTATRAGSAVPQAKARRKRLTLPRLMFNIFLVIAIALAIFYGGGGWYYSNQIYEDNFLPVTPTGAEYDVSVTGVSGDAVTLLGAESHADINGQGIRGIQWPDGYGQVDQIRSQAFIEGDDELQLEVVRSYQPTMGNLASGTNVTMEPYAFPSDPLTAFGIPYETITYRSDLGPMPAWYIRGNTSTWMIFVHDKSAPLRESLRFLPVAFDRNYHILIIDYRNDPGSPIDPSGMYQYGATEWNDLDAAAFHARENGAEKVVYVGYGMGGSIVTSFLTQSPLRNQAAAAILDSPVLDLEAAVDHQVGNRTLPLPFIEVDVPSSLTAVAKWMTGIRYRISWEDYDWLDDWQKLSVPMLIFHGTEDTMVPATTSRSLANARPNLVTVIETSADHLVSWNMEPGVYEAEATVFLAEHAG